MCTSVEYTNYTRKKNKGDKGRGGAHPTSSTSILSFSRDRAPEEELLGTGVWLGDPTGVVTGDSVPTARPLRARLLGNELTSSRTHAPRRTHFAWRTSSSSDIAEARSSVSLAGPSESTSRRLATRPRAAAATRCRCSLQKKSSAKIRDTEGARFKRDLRGEELAHHVPIV